MERIQNGAIHGGQQTMSHAAGKRPSVSPLYDMGFELGQPHLALGAEDPQHMRCGPPAGPWVQKTQRLPISVVTTSMPPACDMRCGPPAGPWVQKTQRLPISV